MPLASLIFHSKRIYDDGGVVELKIWALPRPVASSAHRLKYSLLFGRNGRRLVGYDNERGKGDHRHIGDFEEPYAFTTLDALVADFHRDVLAAMGR